MATMKDVADRADLSIATISRVFRGNGYVSKETREAVLLAAEQVGYTPNCYKKSGRSVLNTSAVGLIVPDLSNGFFQEIIRAMDGTFQPRGIDLYICNSDEDPQRELRYLSNMQSLNIGGIIIAPVSEAVDYNQELIKKLIRSKLPIVLLDREVSGVKLDGVFQENYKSTISAMELFIRNGHTHIATIAGPPTSRPGLERLNGYMAALRQHGIPVRSEYILYGDFKVESAYQKTKQLLRQYDAVTAIFCANNLMAIGALQAITELGLSVPGDIALISFGSLHQYMLSDDMPITILKQPTESMGRKCAEIMLELLGSDGRRANKGEHRITMSVDVVSRGSEVYPPDRRRHMPRTAV